MLVKSTPGAELGLIVLINPSIKDKQPGVGINNYYGVKVSRVSEI
jgi:hypothetical protein